MQLNNRMRDHRGIDAWSMPFVRFMMILLCSSTLAAHYYLMRSQSIDWIHSPISALSQSGNAAQHTMTLYVFALAQALLALCVRTAKNGWLTKSIQSLCLLAAALIVTLGPILTTDNTAEHTFRLSLIASVVGVIMACLIARDKDRKQRRAAYRISITSLTVWMGLIPLAFVMNENYIGAYQRAVGVVYIAWLCALAMTRTSLPEI